MYKWCLSRPSTNRYRCCFATHCNTLLHTATHCYTLQHTHILTIYIHIQWCPSRPSTHPISLLLCDSLQHTATHCYTLQHTATRCNTLQHAATHTYCDYVYTYIQSGAYQGHPPTYIAAASRSIAYRKPPPRPHTCVFCAGVHSLLLNPPTPCIRVPCVVCLYYLLSTPPTLLLLCVPLRIV